MPRGPPYKGRSWERVPARAAARKLIDVTSGAMTSIVFGKGRVAIKASEILLAEGYTVEFVVPSHELVSDTSFSDWADRQSIPLRRIEGLDELLPLHADLGVSTYFDRIFRQRHIDSFGKLLNVHNSLLPRYRGVRPINWALKNQERKHGVSLHLITPGIDEGAILDQEAFPIDPVVDEVRDVYIRCLNAAEVLLERALPDVWGLPARHQAEAQAFYHSANDDEKLGDRRFFTRGATGLDQ